MKARILGWSGRGALALLCAACASATPPPAPPAAQATPTASAVPSAAPGPQRPGAGAEPAAAPPPRGQFLLLPPPPPRPLPPAALRFKASLAQPSPPSALRDDEAALRRALGLGDQAKLGSATLENDADGSLWVLIDTPAGKIPLRPVSLAEGVKVDCRLPSGGAVSDTFLVRGAPIALAVQLRRTMNVIAVDEDDQCLDLSGEMPQNYLPEVTHLSVAWAKTKPAEVADRFVGPLMTDDAVEQHLDLHADRVEVFVGGQRVARSDDLLWPGLMARPLRDWVFQRLAGGGFSLRTSTARRRSSHPPPWPDFARLARDHEERDYARIAVLADGRVLPEYLVTHQERWELGARDPLLCGVAAIPRCADGVLQEHWYDDFAGSYYFYRKAGVLRWTVHSTQRLKMTRDARTTCAHDVHEEQEESRWHVRTWADPRWHPLSVATVRGRTEGINTVRRCFRD
jgi:hypothetical protein